MNIIEWKESMSVGNVNLDAEHKQLISLVNKIANSLATNSQQATAKDLIDELTESTIDHFHHEENIFNSSAYPHSENHRLKHSELIQKLKQISETIPQTDHKTGNSIIIELKDLFNDHILQTDMAYAGYITNY